MYFFVNNFDFRVRETLKIFAKIEFLWVKYVITDISSYFFTSRNVYAALILTR